MYLNRIKKDTNLKDCYWFMNNFLKVNITYPSIGEESGGDISEYKPLNIPAATPQISGSNPG